MLRIFKILAILLVLGLVGLVGYAYLGDLSPEQKEIRQPVVLDVE